MPLTLLQDVNFGPRRGNLTGSTGVGYTVLDVSGSVVVPHTTAGVYQLAPGSGIYAANVTYPDDFNGQILWDCPPVTGSGGFMLSQSYAAEQYNVQANDPKVADTWQMINDITGSILGLYDVAFGRWKIDKATNTMTFFGTDNVSKVATFNLFDDTGTPAYDGVFERQLASPVTPVGGGPGAGAGGTQISWMEIPAGVADGINTSFVLLHQPSPTGSLMFFINGLVQDQGFDFDYVVSGSTITVNYAYPSGSNLLATYPY